MVYSVHEHERTPHRHPVPRLRPGRRGSLRLAHRQVLPLSHHRLSVHRLLRLAGEVTAEKDVAVWAEKARAATLRRDQAIRAMRGEGASLRTIAAAAGLSHMAVSKIIAKGT